MLKKALQSLVRRCGLEIHRIEPAPAYAVFPESMVPDYDLLALRSFADRAAQFSISHQQTQALSNLYLTGILREQPFAGRNRIEIGNANTRQVGIWRKQRPSKDAPFIRIADADVDSWARKNTIEPRRCKFRVALVGESVARGYLYDPEFTPAAALEQMLKSYLGSAEIDVVDLAQNSITMQPLKALIGQSLALSPDVIVVFAGNNWHMQLSDSDIPYIDSTLRSDGVPGLKAYVDSLVRHAVTQLTEQVSALMNGRKITVIWVVPESNLDDWHDPLSTAPLLPKKGNSEWRDLNQRASLAFRQGDLNLVEKLAREMVNLDGGTNAVPLRILAECCRGRADLRGTKQYLEMCRDSEGWNPSFPYSPRTSITIQDALRATISAPGHRVVDLPELFSHHLHDHPPGRRLFLDYCHLSSEGINLAMAAIGAKVLEALSGRPVAIEKVHSYSPSISDEVEGRASLLSAVHNAHYYQGRELVSYWCERALRFWPESAQIMQRFVDFQTRRGDTMACKSAIELFDRREFATLIESRKRLDLLLIDAMVGCLADAGIDIRRQLADLRAREHSFGTGSKELTDFYYCSAMARPSESGWTSKSFLKNVGSHSIYTSAFSETSKFVFFGERARPVGLKLTYRVPGPGKLADTIKIAVNGHQLAQAPADATWQTFEVCVLSNCVTDGLNEIVISWPEEGESSEVLLNRAADTLLARRMPRFYRVFGEIHSLRAFDPEAPAEQALETRLANSDRQIVVSDDAAELVTSS